MKKILICEDDPDMAKLIAAVVESGGYALTYAANGREAVSLAIEKKPDLVLMDLRMPELDGLKAIKLLRDQGYKKPIVIVTASESPKDREMAMAAGANAFIVKNIVMSGLEGTLERLLD